MYQAQYVLPNKSKLDWGCLVNYYVVVICRPDNKWPLLSKQQIGTSKNLEEKDGQRQLLCYVSLIRACNKVLYQLVYIGKKFVFLKKNLGI